MNTLSAITSFIDIISTNSSNYEAQAKIYDSSSDPHPSSLTLGALEDQFIKYAQISFSSYTYGGNPCQ